MTKRVLIILGTRPEAIKIAPIVLAMRENDCSLQPLVCLTGQHPQIAQEALDVFDINADLRMECVPAGGDLCLMAGSVIESTGRLIDDQRPDLVMVQGDTLSAFAGGLAAVLRKCPVAHVEAGLRSGRMDDPFPEEIARRQLSHICEWSFAPTRNAAENLLSEGIEPHRVHQVGNTVVDAMRIVRARMPHTDRNGRKTILVTIHRRENWGGPMQNVLKAVRELAQTHADWRFVFSVHPNPDVSRLVREELIDLYNVELLNAPRYDQWVKQLVSCDLIMTDSGGLQEEGAAIGRPVMVLRKTTERPEAVQAGTAVVVGTETHRVVTQAREIMTDSNVYESMACPSDVFGDGYASQRIVSILNGQPIPITENDSLSLVS